MGHQDMESVSRGFLIGYDSTPPFEEGMEWQKPQLMANSGVDRAPICHEPFPPILAFLPTPPPPPMACTGSLKQ